MRAANLDHGAVHLHQGDAQQVVGRHAVFQAMRAAGVHRDVPGNGAGELRGRIGCIEKALRFDRTCHAEVGPTGLNPDEPVVEVGLQHLVQPRDAQDHAVRRGQRATGQRSARAAWNHRNALFVAYFQDGGHIFG